MSVRVESIIRIAVWVFFYQTPQYGRNGKAYRANNKYNVFVTTLLDKTSESKTYDKLRYDHRKIKDAHEQTHSGFIYFLGHDSKG